ncbi:sulfocyanin-like copper-binding protein [Verrucomicrobiota bacterium sgz303538]
MKRIPLHSLSALVLVTALSVSAGAQDTPATHHDPAAHAGAGLKKELIAGIAEADFLKLGDKPNTAKITLVTAFTDANYGMNFNGYSHGKATYTIPAGWTVEVTCINPSPVPHSVIVVERDEVKRLQFSEPVFKGASTPNPMIGISTSKASFTFTASEAGDYAFACGFPSHSAAGQWIALDVSADAKVPTLKLGDGPVKEATK